MTINAINYDQVLPHILDAAKADNPKVLFTNEPTAAIFLFMFLINENKFGDKKICLFKSIFSVPR